MIIKVSWETMINNLLENQNEVINQVLVVCWILLNLNLKVVKGTRHDTNIFITECFFHLQVHLLHW